MAEPSENRQSDPSTLTTQLVWREVLHLKELFESRISAVEKSIEVAHEDLVRVPTEVQRAVGTLEALDNEKFVSIEKQFKERDVRVEQTARDTKTAVDAALAAQEKAVGKQNESFSLATAKSETAITKQIDQLGVLLGNATKGLEDKINDVKDRLTRLEGSDYGAESSKLSQRSSTNSIIALIALFIAVAGIIIGAVVKLSN